MMESSELSEMKRDPAIGVVLTFLTCGIYSLLWQDLQIRTINALLGRDELSFWRWLGLTLLTCGLYHIYHEYIMARYILEIQHLRGVQTPDEDLPMIALILSIVGLPFITDAIEQKTLNQLIDHVEDRGLRG